MGGAGGEWNGEARRIGEGGRRGQLLGVPKGRTQLGTELRPIVLSSPIAVYNRNKVSLTGPARRRSATPGGRPPRDERGRRG
eukprot:scaffold130056_cov21-Phaeocystis_antarctica.AAC.1